MVLPIAALGLRGLAGLLGRSGAGKSMQSAMGRALGNKKIMPFAGKKPGSAGAITADVNLTRDAARRAAVEKLMAAEKRKALLTALGIGGVGGVAAGAATESLLGAKSSDATLGDVTQPSIYGGDFNAINFRPKEESELLMGPREPNELTIEDLIMRGDTNEPVTTGGENDFSYLRRGGMEVDEFGNFIKPQDRMPDSGQVDLLKLLGLR